MLSAQSTLASPASGADIYTDFAGLGKLKNLAGADGKAALEEVARQFESIFLNIALKSMRDANAAFSEGSYFDSNQSRMYRDMLDQQMSVSLTEGKGLGLADVLVKQMAKYVPDEATDAPADAASPSQPTTYLPGRRTAVSSYQAAQSHEAGN